MWMAWRQVWQKKRFWMIKRAGIWKSFGSCWHTWQAPHKVTKISSLLAYVSSTNSPWRCISQNKSKHTVSNKLSLPTGSCKPAACVTLVHASRLIGQAGFYDRCSRRRQGHFAETFRGRLSLRRMVSRCLQCRKRKSARLLRLFLLLDRSTHSISGPKWVRKRSAGTLANSFVKREARQTRSCRRRGEEETGKGWPFAATLADQVLAACGTQLKCIFLLIPNILVLTLSSFTIFRYT